MEKTSKFTVELTKEVYTMLLKESKIREGSKGAVPSRTARQLIEEKLQEIDEARPKVIPMTEAIRAKIAAEEDTPEKKSKKPKSTKRDVGADESTPTI